MTPPLPIWLFWLSFGFIFYTYFFYPFLIGILARLRPRPVRRSTFQPSISIVISAHNESANIARRVQNLLEQDYPENLVEILIVSDGSTYTLAAQYDSEVGFVDAPTSLEVGW